MSGKQSLLDKWGIWNDGDGSYDDESETQPVVATSTSAISSNKTQTAINLSTRDVDINRYIIAKVDKNNTPEFQAFIQQLIALGNVLKDDASLLLAAFTATQQIHPNLRSSDIISMISSRKVSLEQASKACIGMIEVECTEQTKSTQKELDGVNSEMARLKNELKTLEARKSRLSTQVSEYIDKKTSVLSRLQKIVADLESIISDRLALAQQHLK